MTAKEMFKALGYELRNDDYEQIYYYLKKETYTRSVEFRKFAKDFCIRGMEWLAKDSCEWVTMSKYNLFRDEFDKYCAKYGHWRNTEFIYVDMELHKAIHQQCKELGWLDENN